MTFDRHSSIWRNWVCHWEILQTKTVRQWQTFDELYNFQSTLTDFSGEKSVLLQCVVSAKVHQFKPQFSQIDECLVPFLFWLNFPKASWLTDVSCNLATPSFLANTAVLPSPMDLCIALAIYEYLYSVLIHSFLTAKQLFSLIFYIFLCYL